MATDKFKGFIELAAQNPDILAQVGDLVKGFNQTDDGFGLDDIGDLAGGFLGSKSGDKGSNNPLESLLVLFKQFTAK